MTGGRGWWGNKQAFQIGLKYIDAFGLRNLDLQVETNVVRPYVYSDKDSLTGYTNYNANLAHPLGANFYELIGIARYQPVNRLNLIGKAFYTKQGLNINQLNYGGDPLRSYLSRVSEYGNRIGQGDLSQTLYLSFTASYMLKHNFFIDFNQVFRDQNSKSGAYDLNTAYTSVSIRWNIQSRLQEF